MKHGLEPILQPEDVKAEAFAQEVASLQPDIIVVVAFKILPPAVYTTARKGAFNLHGSLLPRYRGAAPINRAVMAGERETGVTTFFLEQKVDTGNVILQRSMEIGDNETSGEVHDRMMILGAEVVLETVRRILENRAVTQNQDDSLATSAPKIFKDDCQIDWTASSKRVHDHVRGLSPYPGAWTTHNGQQFKIYRTQMGEGHGTPGEILAHEGKLVVACGEGAVEIEELQMENRRRMDVEAFLRGHSLDVQSLFA